MPKTNPVRKHYGYSIKDIYKEFKKDKKQSDPECDDILPYKQYKSLIKDFFHEIFLKIINENHIFIMPYSLGSILVKSCKTNLKKAWIDYHLTKKHGKVVKYINQHSFGYYFRIVWEKSYVRFKNKVYYLFGATRSQAATNLGIGKIGLSRRIKELSKSGDKRSFIRI